MISLSQLEYLSQARSEDQFEVLADLVVENWAMKEEAAYAQWFHDEYLSDPWDLWFCTASNTPGVVPNQNKILN
ncbi:unnamed protein product [Phytophthora lilii]|uniref:Unnamed protein product n=1 Tax=Phytophthora lilii TaxID=2077276 RepID=A0A9W6XEA3_9STRA|nr:unnamed protein product [Phytophthora lilii]